jgi:hypothetical protein
MHDNTNISCGTHDTTHRILCTQDHTREDHFCYDHETALFNIIIYNNKNTDILIWYYFEYKMSLNLRRIQFLNVGFMKNIRKVYIP